LQEKLKLEWLAPRPLPVPEVLLFIPEEAADYLLLSEIPGAPASDDALKQDVPRLIEQLADGLHTIHGLPIEDCPFPAQSDLKIETARQRMLDKLIDESDFDEIRHGETAEKLFGELVATAPAEEDLVFTHGDYCLPNVLLENGKVSGFVDWGNAGIADRYQDIALLARSVRYNFSADWTKFLFDTLGIEPDLKKIDFYQLLDEFF
jgi:aminoglycoside phosphotransferase